MQSETFGGSIYSTNGNLSVYNSTFESNRANTGAAIALLSTESNVLVDIYNIYIDVFSSYILLDNLFIRNFAF